MYQSKITNWRIFGFGFSSCWVEADDFATGAEVDEVDCFEKAALHEGIERELEQAGSGSFDGTVFENSGGSWTVFVCHCSANCLHLVVHHVGKQKNSHT